MDDHPTPSAATDVHIPRVLAHMRNRVGMAAAFTLLPLASFLLSDGFVTADWQSGTEARWGSLFATEARGVISVVLAVFGLGMAAIAIRPDLRRHPIGRAVAVGAVASAGFYVVALTIATQGTNLIFSAFFLVWVLIAWMAVVLARRVRAQLGGAEHALAALAAVCLLAVAALAIVEPLRNALLAFLFWGALSLAGAGPLLCLLIAARVLIDSRSGWTAASSLLSIGAVAAVAVGIADTWQRAMDHYAALPLTDPYADCYVASAATHSHPALTGSWSAPTAVGSVSVTPQLVRLKAVELLVRSACPTLHAHIRSVYDRVGPPIAARVTTPLRSDLAWLSLVPLSLCAAAILRLAPAEARNRAHRLHPRITEAPRPG